MPASNEVNNQDLNMQDLNLTTQRLVRLFVLHDLLPWKDEAQGLTVPELVDLLTRTGFDCQRDTVGRDLRELEKLVFLEYEKRGGKVFWKRVYDTPLTRALANPPALPAVCFRPAANDDQFVAA
ncbi:MAG: hypothetical protein ACNA7J_12050 [Wenzhouxiangella sp.]